MNSSRFHLAKSMMPKNRRTPPAVLPYVAHKNANCKTANQESVSSKGPKKCQLQDSKPEDSQKQSE